MPETSEDPALRTGKGRQPLQDHLALGTPWPHLPTLEMHRLRAGELPGQVPTDKNPASEKLDTEDTQRVIPLMGNVQNRQIHRWRVGS